MIFRALSSVFLLFSLFSFSESVDFTCPTKNITGGGGTFPRDQNTIVQFPAGYSCVIEFAIPPGYVVKLTLAANVTDDTKDAMLVQDTLNKHKQFSQGVSLFVAPAPNAYVVIQSLTGQSQFWFRYEFVYVALLERVQYSTGEPFPLNIVPVKSYTVTSPKQLPIVLHTGSATTRDDKFLSEIFVYDGPDVMSTYIGRLYDLVTSPKLVKSSGKSLTLLNQYGTYSSSYAIANDYIELLPYDSYSFEVFNSAHNIDLLFMNNAGGSQAHTFYCIDQPFSYISSLSIADQNSDKKSLKITAQSPTNPMLTRLTYLSTDNIPQYMPQQIPGNLFTVTTDFAQFKIGVQSNNDIQNVWKTPRAGRFGTIYSPSLWTAGATPAYGYDFESASLLKFSFNVQSAVMSAPGEELSVKIGSAGSAPFTTTFTKSVSNPGVRVANGTYMSATFTGNSPASSSIITFQMDDPNGSVVSSTTTTVETSTKSVGRFDVLPVFMMILLYFYH